MSAAGMAPPRGSSGPQTLQAPLMASTPDPRQPGPSLLQRLMRRRLPDPSAALLVLAALAGCTCLVDRYISYQRPLSEEATTDQGATSLGDAPVLGAAPLGTQRADVDAAGGLLVLGTAVVVLLALCHVLCEKWIEVAVAQAAARLGLSVKLGRVRTWIFLGRLEVRNSFVLNPVGFACEHALRVRTLTVDFSLKRLLLSLGTQSEFHALNIDGLEALVEERRGGLGDTNLTEVVTQVQNAASGSTVKHPMTIRKVEIQDVAAIKVGGRCAGLPDMIYHDLSKETGAGSLDMAVLAILRRLEADSLAVL